MRSLHHFALEIRGGRPVARHRFRCAVDAEEGARILAKLAGGALAYQQWGDVEAGIWDEPEPLLAVGRRLTVDEMLAA